MIALCVALAFVSFSAVQSAGCGPDCLGNTLPTAVRAPRNSQAMATQDMMSSVPPEKLWLGGSFLQRQDQRRSERVSLAEFESMTAQPSAGFPSLPLEQSEVLGPRTLHPAAPGAPADFAQVQQLQARIQQERDEVDRLRFSHDRLALDLDMWRQL
eukprot:CAMPEP_0194544360 /NCGR_PEP_ID=MMETSP0253-20130528/87427_1 /TAXON_ID=2966 /ORGANISM="Noctiluca scintillans" /LENGTH=155 /DNA_ID=CAMNT_0039391239 /DNA_START=66 /DNA_END=530 /DNA_ORIENTATION=-